MKRRMTLVLLVSTLGCGGSGTKSTGDGGQTARCGNGVLDQDEQCDNGPWNGFDGVCSIACVLLNQPHTTFQAKVGINRDIVPEYAGDACASVARYLLVDVIGPNGASLPHQDLDCTQGQSGWLYNDVSPGEYRVTMQLLDEARQPLTEPKSSTASIIENTTAIVWVDFDHHDFSTGFSGNLKWQVKWGAGLDGGTSGLDGTSCDDAIPAVGQMRVTLRDEAGAVVHAQATTRHDGELVTTPTDGVKVACHSYGTSDAEVVASLPWGIYDLTVEGFDQLDQLAFCARRPIFATNGEGIIFRAYAAAGACP
jgi:hypothetical protein